METCYRTKEGDKINCDWQPFMSSHTEDGFEVDGETWLPTVCIVKVYCTQCLKVKEI